MKFLRFLNGLPGIALALFALAGVFRLYVHQKEQNAVAQFKIQQVRDSVAHADSIRADSIRLIIKRWQDSTAGLQRKEELAKAQTRIADSSRAAASEALHALVDTMPAVLKAAVDSLEARQGRQVLSLQEALAAADAKHTEDSTTILDLHDQILGLQSSNFRLLTQLDESQKRSAPGFLKKLIDVSPVIAATLGIGIATGVAIK